MKNIPILFSSYRDRPELTGKLAPAAGFMRATPAFDQSYKRIEPNIPRVVKKQGLILSGPLNNALTNSNDFTLSTWKLNSVTIDGVHNFGDISLTRVRGNNKVNGTPSESAVIFHNLNIFTPVAINRQWRISALVKEATGNVVVIEISNGNNNGYYKVKYFLSTGETSGGSIRFKPDIRHIRDGIYEISLHDTVGFANSNFNREGGPHPFGIQLNKRGHEGNNYALPNDADLDGIYIGNVSVTYVDYYPGVFYSYAHSEGDSMRSIAGEVYRQRIDNPRVGTEIVAEFSSAGPVRYEVFGYSKTISYSANVTIKINITGENKCSIVFNDELIVIDSMENQFITVEPLEGGNCVFKSLRRSV